MTLWFQLAQLRAAGAGAGAGADAGGDAGGGALDLAALSIAPGDLLVMLLVLVPLAVFISAAMMSLALLAREFKEASNYLSPFFLLILAPAMLAAAAGVELEGAVVLVPVANATLLFKNLLMDTATWAQALGTFASTAVAAALALRLATWVFGREDVVLAGDGGLPASLRRGSWRPRAAPTAGLALGVFAASLLLFVNAGALLQAWAPLPGLIASQWGILLAVPVAALWFFRVRLRTGLKLRAPRAGGLAGALLMALGALVLSQQLAWWQSFVLEVPAAFHAGVEPLLTHPSLPLVLFAVAVSPAVCEELLFRGAVLSGLQTRLRPWVAVTLTGVLFGLLHLYLHRLLLTAALGVAIGWVAWQTRSVWPGVLLHFVNNAAAVLAVRGALPGSLNAYLERVNPAENGFPAAVVLGAAGVFAAGVALVRVSARRARRTPGAGSPVPAGGS